MCICDYCDIFYVILRQPWFKLVAQSNRITYGFNQRSNQRIYLSQFCTEEFNGSLIWRKVDFQWRETKFQFLINAWRNFLIKNHAWLKEWWVLCESEDNQWALCRWWNHPWIFQLDEKWLMGNHPWKIKTYSPSKVAHKTQFYLHLRENILK